MLSSSNIRKIALILICIFLIGCVDNGKSTYIESSDQEQKLDVVDDTIVWDIENSVLNNMTLQDNKGIYGSDIDNEVITLYLTVYPTPDEEGNLLTMADFDKQQARQMDYNPELEVLMQEGDESGPLKDSFGFGALEPNGIIRVRGHSARGGLYKSFKVKLYDRAGSWRNQKVLNLNKHPFDTTKVTNKFAFDYFEMLPDIVSFRTQFVHLYIKDISKDSNEYVDYGLYTHIEQPNKTFLRSHGLDDAGNMYKARSFEFLRYPDKLKAEDDPEYDEVAFDTVLNIRESKSHKKLLNMLDDVNNMNLDFNQVFNTHFNKENYLTWIAINVIFGNEDTVSQNFIIYSPQNAMTWYFLPWDYDGGMKYGGRRGVSSVVDSMYGIGRYWGVILHRRFFRNPENVEALTLKIDELMEIITPENTKDLTDSYKPVIKKYIYKTPDIGLLRTRPDFVEPYLDSYQEIIEYNRERYINALENPMPVFVAEPIQNQDGTFLFSWEPSHDIQGDLITYNLDIARDYNFTNIVFSKDNMKETSVNTSKINTGIYYWRLTIKDSKGNTQASFNNYLPDGAEETLWGVSQLIVR